MGAIEFMNPVDANLRDRKEDEVLHPVDQERATTGTAQEKQAKPIR
jgi:hypothetical protein